MSESAADTSADWPSRDLFPLTTAPSEDPYIF